jgi:hypothetical protein
MPDIQVGDLVKYSYNFKDQPDDGVFLVIAVEVDAFLGEIVILKQGYEQRFAHPTHLDKISSSR